MSDILAITGILLFLGLAYPGLLLTWRLLFPNLVERAQVRLERTPWRAFWLGLGVVLVFSIPALALISSPAGIAKFLGWMILTPMLALASMGAAGQASRMGARLPTKNTSATPGARRFLLGALALELASAFPIIGWFLFLPLSTIIALGAGVFALLRWMPKTAPQENAKTAKVDVEQKPLQA